ncbi:MAG TPA: DUF523 domain-containing protein [Gammaproteobacteria bacterium]|nr:DUF523 domain-containing protein [Gammaproteobacteria bacterium]
MDRPRIAISSCLLGEPVRYDGGHKRNPRITDELSQQFDWLPLCPELEAGLGVPRPPVRLVGDRQQPRALGIDNPGLDVSAALTGCAQRMLPRLHDVSGYIFKSRSPSCGLIDTPLVDSDGRDSGVTAGLYAALVRAAMPKLPLIDEQQLEQADRREQFLREVEAYRQSQAGRGG